MFRTGLIIMSLMAVLYANKMERGKAIYTQSCRICHGAMDGTIVKKRFIVQPRQLNATILSKEQISKVISKGSHYWGAYQGVMPEFERLYDQASIEAVSAYVDAMNVRGLQRVEKYLQALEPLTPDVSIAMVAHGENIYVKSCAYCHGHNGDGKGEATRNPPLSVFPHALRDIVLNEAQIYLYTKYGGIFWGMHNEAMQGWANEYDDYALQSVARYIVEKILVQK